MARTEKKTKIKGLPPRVRLGEASQTQGKYPLVNHSGMTSPTGSNLTFNDQAILAYGTASIYYGTGMAVRLSGTLVAQGIPTSSLTGSGQATSQNADGWLATSGTVSFSPYTEHNQFAVDSKGLGREFWATGSNIEGFTAPLWSKNIIEIDISSTTQTAHKTFISSGVSMTGSSWPMTYYNFQTKKWEGLGIGRPWKSHNEAGYAMHGFTPSIINLLDVAHINYQLFEFQAGAGRVFSNLSFPYGPRFHATQSQTLAISDYITAPFVVEKILIKLTASYEIYSEAFTSATYAQPVGNLILPACINNIFLLNQRRPVNQNKVQRLFYDDLTSGDKYITASLPQVVSLSLGAAPVYVDSIRDIITYGSVTSMAANISGTVTRSVNGPGGAWTGALLLTSSVSNNLARDIVLSSSVTASANLTPMNWTGSLTFELFAKSPNNNDYVFSYVNDEYGISCLNTDGGRNGLGLTFPTGRDLGAPINGTPSVLTVNYAWLSVNELTAYGLNYTSNVPYILQPGDNLVLGWQQPTPSTTSDMPNSMFSTMTFLTGSAKLVLYGSYLQNGISKNDTLAQALTSENIHEVVQ